MAKPFPEAISSNDESRAVSSPRLCHDVVDSLRAAEFEQQKCRGHVVGHDRHEPYEIFDGGVETGTQVAKDTGSVKAEVLGHCQPGFGIAFAPLDKLAVRDEHERLGRAFGRQDAVCVEVDNCTGTQVPGIDGECSGKSSERCPYLVNQLHHRSLPANTGHCSRRGTPSGSRASGRHARGSASPPRPVRRDRGIGCRASDRPGPRSHRRAGRRRRTCRDGRYRHRDR